jgi:hypothetical protein
MSVKGMLLRGGILTTGEDIDLFRGDLKIKGKSRTPDTTAVTAILRDASGNILLATGTTVPGDETGFAKSCIFIKTDAADGTAGIYENIGTTASSDFNLVGAVSAGEITLATDNVLLGVGGVAAATPSDTLIRTVKVSLSNSEIKNLTTAPKTLVAAPAANHMIRFLGATLELQAGSEALTEATDNLIIGYVDESGIQASQVIETTGFIDQTVNTHTTAQPKIDVIGTPAQLQAQALVLYNNNADFGGNASNDATLDVYVTYVDIDMS